MPMAMPRPCSQPGCTALVRDGSGRCADHPKRAWQSSKPAQRLRGRRGVERRKLWLILHPYCKHCEAEGVHTLGSIVDHEIPLAEGGPDHDSNLQTLCRRHDKIKTAAESKRGRARQAEG